MFQAEVLTISEVAKNLFWKKMLNQSIVVLVDSEAAIKSLIKCTVASITVFNCIRNLNQLAKQNHVSIAWIFGHAGVRGNELCSQFNQGRLCSQLNQDLNQKYLALSLILQSRMPAVLARLRTGQQIDGNLCGMNGKTA